MNYTILDIEQRSAEWFQARAGRLTGSRAGDMLKTIRSGEAAGRRDYRMQLATERRTGIPEDGGGFVSKAMQRGIDMEAFAFAAYEAITGQMVQRAGFIQSTEHLAGYSPDGIIPGDALGLLELKCPQSSTHWGYLRADVLPREHYAQVRHALWLTGAAWLDFVSFDDRLGPGLDLFVCRVTPDGADLPDYEKKALAFLKEVSVECAAMQTLAGVREPVARPAVES
jgi:hypothetical protein